MDPENLATWPVDLVYRDVRIHEDPDPLKRYADGIREMYCTVPVRIGPRVYRHIRVVIAVTDDLIRDAILDWREIVVNIAIRATEEFKTLYPR